MLNILKRDAWSVWSVCLVIYNFSSSLGNITSQKCRRLYCTQKCVMEWISSPFCCNNETSFIYGVQGLSIHPLVTWIVVRQISSGDHCNDQLLIILCARIASSGKVKFGSGRFRPTLTMISGCKGNLFLNTVKSVFLMGSYLSKTNTF